MKTDFVSENAITGESGKKITTDFQNTKKSKIVFIPTLHRLHYQAFG